MKKGFTLVELLAVIVILAIIGLIVTPQVLSMIKHSEEASAVDSAYVYIEALEKQNVMAVFDKKYPLYEKGTYKTEDIKVSVKGSYPTSGTVEVNRQYQVGKAELCMKGYLIEYEMNRKTKTSGKC